MKLLLSSLLAVLVFFNSSCQRGESKSQINIVYDAEMDLDDVCSLYLLARNYKDQIDCVTISGTEHYRFDKAPEYASRALTLTQRENIPISGLFTSSFCEAMTMPDTWGALVENISSASLPKSTVTPLPMTGPELLLKIIHSTKGKLIILCLGPLNNIAHAITEHPTIREKIERIVILGGSLHSTESITVPPTDRWKESSDYNFFVDPCAANIVLTSQIPITLVPLDITNLAPLNPIVLDKYAPEPKTDGAKFVLSVLRDASQGSTQKSSMTPFWDMVAAATVFEPSITKLEKISLKVITDPGEGFGNIVEANDGTLIDVCTYIDPEKFYTYYFNLVNR